MKRRDMLKFTGVAVSGAALAKFTDSAITAPSTATTLTDLTPATSTIPLATSAATPASLLTPPVPVLPQYDNLVGSVARNTALGLKQLSYTWTENYPNVEGIPMLATLPANELPVIEWLIPTAGKIVELIVNFFASIPATGSALWQAQANSIIADFSSAKSRYDSFVKSNANQSALSPAALAASQQIQQSLLSIFTRVGVLVTQITPHVNELFNNNAISGADGLAAYKALFATVPLPPSASEFQKDDYFANLRVAGPNPVLIKGISALPSNFPLSNAQYIQVMGANDSLSAAAASNRLYLLDYADVGAMATQGAVNKILSGTGYAFAPIALFAIPVGSTSLTPVAIQCGQDPHAYPIFLPTPANDTSSPTYWAWQMAKTAVQVAEENYHEMYVHLARTHLVSEAFCIATPRHLAPTHPLNVLLTPHLEGSLFINTLAALVLMEPGGFVDVLFAAPISDLQKSAGADRLGFDFYAHMLPTDLANRKVDNVNTLPHYPYRDDALLVWNAIAQWAQDYINIYYTSDADVVNDRELVAWTNEIISSGKLNGFKAITSRQQLTDVITMVIFTASAQHAAVNFSQPSIMTYAPAIAAHSSASVPANSSVANEQAWLAMMPSMLAAEEKLVIYNILGGVYHGQLGQYNRTTFPYQPVFTDTRVSAPLTRFQSTLQQIEATIVSRNLSRARPYPFLLPSHIPQSTNI
ncbi:lipoxygenase family protein [Aquirhabdus sp.]|uniref:lipoxygenase family protein n=1 Tax=Aquirhabdus sp. TaxID=2824160 RepID=UPI00396CB195